MRKPNDTARGAEATEAAIGARATVRAAELGCEERLGGRRDDHELRGVLRAFVREIETEPIDSRRAMLEAAAVEALVLDLPAATLARAERVLRDLDPDDASELRRLADVRMPSVPSNTDPEHVRYLDGVCRRQQHEASPARDVLELVGLVKIDPSFSRGLYGLPLLLTPRGALALELLNGWVASAERAS